MHFNLAYASWRPAMRHFNQRLLMMKFTALFLLASGLHVYATGFSQTVTISVRNVAVKKVFKEIIRQTGISIIYNEKYFDSGDRVTINVKEAPVEEVLINCLKNQPVSFKIEENKILIEKKDRFPTRVRSPQWEQIETLFEVEGRVTNSEGNSLSDVSVVVKGAQLGVASDANGQFRINAPAENSVLVFSYIGFETQEVPLNGQSSIRVVLLQSESKMDDIVVVGYGTQRKKDLTGAVVRIDMSEKLTGNNSTLFQALQGAAPGLNVQGAGGLAGDAPSVSVRGQTSLSATDAPLIVLDGIIYNGSVNDININDVESIDVLKDASAAAVYGARSANGVLLITTKKGKTDQPRLTVNASYGLYDFAKMLPIMNAEQYAIRLVDYYWEQQLYAWYKTNPTSPAGRPVRPDITDRNVVSTTLRSQEEKDNYLAGGHDIDWFDEVSRIGQMQNYDVNISGKSGRSNYYISGSLTDQEGVLLNDQFTRATVRANLESKVRDWLTIGLTSSYSNRDYSGLETDLGRAQFASPLVNKYTEIGTYPMYFGTETYQLHPLTNLLADNYDSRNNLFLLASAKVDIPQVKGLTYDFNYSYNYNTSERASFYPSTIWEGRSNRGLGEKADDKERNWIINNILTYSRTFFTDHRVNATLLYSRENRNASSNNLSATGFGNPALGYNALGLGEFRSNSTGAWEENSLSYMARVNYAFRDRYLITGTIRRDGYSGFGAAKKFATFPSISGAWVISEEDFMRSGNTASLLNFLKIRMSYGLNGNQGIGRYSSFSKMSSNAYIYGSTPAIGVYPSSMGNINLGWESTESFNLGLDYAVLDNRIAGSIEAYTAKTSDVLVTRALPLATGFASVWTNIGGIANKGIELALTTVNIKNANLSWETRFAFSLNRDKITKLYGGEEDRDIGNSWFVGEPISAIYDYKMTGGVWTEEELYTGKINVANFYPGHWRLEDLNKDGKINPNNDRSVIGYRTPNYRFSIGSDLTYKAFALSFMLNSIMGGNGYYLNNNATLLMASTTTDAVQRRNQFAIRQYWTPDNGVDNAPGIFHAPPISGGLYEDRSFIRLQDISLTYRVAKKALDFVRLTDCQIFLAGKNLYTWTRWSGWDPESASNYMPMMKSLTIGARVSL